MSKYDGTPQPSIPTGPIDLGGVSVTSSGAGASTSGLTAEQKRDSAAIPWPPGMGAVKESGHGIYHEPGPSTVGAGNAWLLDAFAHDPDAWDHVVKIEEAAGKNVRNSDGSINPDAVMKAWDAALQASAQLKLNDPNSQVTPFDYLSLYAQRVGTGTEDPTGGPTDTTQTSSSVNLSSASQAAGMADQFAPGLLGREATAGEKKAALARVNAGERGDPSVTTQHVHSDGKGNSTSSQTSHGGFDATDTLRQQFLHAPDFAAYDAAAKLLPALERALGATVSTGSNGTPSL